MEKAIWLLAVFSAIGILISNVHLSEANQILAQAERNNPAVLHKLTYDDLQSVRRILATSTESASLTLRSEDSCSPSIIEDPVSTPKISPETQLTDNKEVIAVIEKFSKSILVKLYRLPDLILIDATGYADIITALKQELESLREILEKSKIESFTCFSTVVNSRLLELEDMKQMYENERMLRVVALIQPERLGQAEVLYNEINNNSLIAPIMDNLYGEPHGDGMTAFVLMLKTIQLRITAYRKWISLLEDNGHLLEGGIVILDKLLQNELDASLAPEPRSEIEDLKARTALYSQTTIAIWGAKIRNNLVDEVVNFGSPNKLHMIGYVFRDLINDLITATYGGDRANFLKTLEFVQALRWNVHKLKGFEALKSLAEGDHRLILGFRIKEAMACLKGPDPEVLEEFLRLKESLTEHVKNIVWHTACRIKSVHTKKYLCSDGTMFDGNNRYAKLKDSEINGNFQLVASIQGEEVFMNVVNINSAYPQHYFDKHTLNNEISPNMRHVSFTTNVAAFNWKIELRETSAVKFYHTGLNSYLSPHIMPGTDTVMIWMLGDGMDSPVFDWSLECDRS